MLISVSFGTTNTGLDVFYTLLNADKSVYQARTQTGVTELYAGSGVYGVQLADSVLAGKTVIWDVDGTTKASSETFPADLVTLATNAELARMMLTNEQIENIDGSVTTMDDNGDPIGTQEYDAGAPERRGKLV